MNVTKIQQEMLAAWVKDPKANKLCYMEQPDGSVFLINKNYPTVGYFIPESKLFLDTLKCQELSRLPFPVFEANQENLLQPLGSYKVAQGLLVEFFEGKGGEVGIVKDLLKHFDRKAFLYQDEEDSTILIYEAPKGAEEAQLVGVVMPMRKI